MRTIEWNEPTNKTKIVSGYKSEKAHLDNGQTTIFYELKRRHFQIIAFYYSRQHKD